MPRLENKVQNKMIEERRISHIPINEVNKIVLGTRERMNIYNRTYIKRMVASYESARRRLTA